MERRGHEVILESNPCWFTKFSDLLDTSFGRDDDDTRRGRTKVGTESGHEKKVRGLKEGETKEGARGDDIQASLGEPGWKKFLGPVANNREY